MLNNRQKQLFYSMYRICYGKENKMKKSELFNRTYYGDDFEFDGYDVTDARQMTDDFNAITLDDSPYFVRFSTYGVYLSSDIIERSEFVQKLRQDANKKHTLASVIEKLPLLEQEKGNV